MTIRTFTDLVQGSDEWLAARCGVLTASEMKLIVTPGKKPAWNDKARAHLYEILGQRLTGHVEPHFVSDDMLRGQEEEVYARMHYEQSEAPVTEVGFITNDRWGFTLGYSPDGLVGDDGLIEAKSRRQKFQVQTIIEHVAAQTIPDEFVLQCQTGLLVSERKWLDFLSISNGMSMPIIRVFPDPEVQASILEAAALFEAKIAHHRALYDAAFASGHRLVPTMRREPAGDMIL